MLTVNRKQFLSALDVVSRAAPTKATMPVLSNVQIAHGAGRLHLACTDLYTSTSTSVPCDGDGIAACAVDARALIDRAKRLGNGHADLSLGADKLTVAEGTRRFAIPFHPVDDCPPIPEPTGWPLVSLRAWNLTRAIDRVLYATSTDETRAHLNSVRWELTPGRLRLVATDGHRMALHDEPCAADALVEPARKLAQKTAQPDDEPSCGWLVALSAMVHLRRIVAAKGADSVHLSTDGTLLYVAVDYAAAPRVTLSHRLVEASFPPYAQVIPSRASADRHVTVAREALLSAVKAVMGAASARTGAVTLTMHADCLDVHAESPEHGTADESLPASRILREADAEEPMRIGVNGRYLVDACEAADGSYVTLSTSGERDPILLYHGAGASTVAVIMPMRI